MRRLLLTADRVESRSAAIAAVAFLISGSSRSRGCTRRRRRDDRRRDHGRWIPSPHFPRFARHAISVRRERQARVESSFSRTSLRASIRVVHGCRRERKMQGREREVIREHEHGMRDQERKRGRKSVARRQNTLDRVACGCMCLNDRGKVQASSLLSSHRQNHHHHHKQQRRHRYSKRERKREKLTQIH